MINLKKGLKIYKSIPDGWVTQHFALEKRGYIGIHNGLSPFDARYRHGQILISSLSF
jgi:hypothetical protein